jgi:hypothetical protein
MLRFRECGIYAAFLDTYGSFVGAGGALCICRDIINPDVIVADGETTSTYLHTAGYGIEGWLNYEIRSDFKGVKPGTT